MTRSGPHRPAGAATHLTSKNAAALLRTSPAVIVELARKLLGREVLDDVRWLDRRNSVGKQRLSQALTPTAPP